MICLEVFANIKKGARMKISKQSYFRGNSINTSTGEIIEPIEIINFHVSDKPKYIMIFEDMPLELEFQITKQQKNVIAVLRRFANDKNCIFQGHLEQASNLMNLDIETVRKYTRQLVGMGIMYEFKNKAGNRNKAYVFNPRYYWKSDLSSRNKFIGWLLSNKIITKNGQQVLFYHPDYDAKRKYKDQDEFESYSDSSVSEGNATVDLRI